MAVLTARHESAYAAFAAFARQARDGHRLDECFIDEAGMKTSFGGGFIHAILHNPEHRTELLHMLSRLGVSDLPEVDHGIWDINKQTGLVDR